MTFIPWFRNFNKRMHFSLKQPVKNINNCKHNFLKSSQRKMGFMKIFSNSFKPKNKYNRIDRLFLNKISNFSFIFKNWKKTKLISSIDSINYKPSNKLTSKKRKNYLNKFNFSEKMKKKPELKPLNSASEKMLQPKNNKNLSLKLRHSDSMRFLIAIRWMNLKQKWLNLSKGGNNLSRNRKRWFTRWKFFRKINLPIGIWSANFRVELDNLSSKSNCSSKIIRHFMKKYRNWSRMNNHIKLRWHNSKIPSNNCLNRLRLSRLSLWTFKDLSRTRKI